MNVKQEKRYHTKGRRSLMCASSMIMDSIGTDLTLRYNHILSPGVVGGGIYIPPTDITNLQAQITELRQELLALKDLITAAQKYDRATDQEECESEEKIDKLRRLCEVAGIDLSDIVVIPKSRLVS